MVAQNVPFFSFNAGEVDRRALARTDLEKMRLAAQVQSNLEPSVLGYATFRPGWVYEANTRGNAATRLLPFVFNVTDRAALEMTSGVMRVFLPGEGFIARTAVSSSVPNGAFSIGSGWIDEDEPGATSSISGGLLRLVGTGANFAVRTRAISTGSAGTEHALRIVVQRGVVTFRVGSTGGDDDLIAETTLSPGVHSLAFTPSGTYHLWLGSDTLYESSVDSVQVEGAGTLELTTPWSDLDALRYDQSGDVIFVASGGPQKRIERRSQRSWSIVDYAPTDGPFLVQNFSATTLTPGAITGTTTLTASRPFFEAGHVNALFRLQQIGQTATASLAGETQATGEVRVSGVGATRAIQVIITGTFDATVTLQRSIGEPGVWEDLFTYTGPIDLPYNDQLSNQIVFYRFVINAGDYVSGTAEATVSYANGIQSGICRVIAVTSATVASVEVLTPFGTTEATVNWSEGAWSDVQGWPTSVAFHDGRLFWGKDDTLFGSISDAFEGFDDDFEGDAAPIQRSIATGGVEGIHWLLSLQRLLAGTGAQEVSIRASAFDEPLTPTQFTARPASSRGSADLPGVKIDANGIFVQRNLSRVFELAYSVEASDYASTDLTRLHPTICEAGVQRLAVSRAPDTHVWLVLQDGTVAVLTYEPNDNVVAWTPVVAAASASGAAVVEDVCVLPNVDGDDVYFVVRRQTAAGTVRFIERRAYIAEARGGQISKTSDAHVVYSGSPTATITGLAHLNGETVVVWADGAPLSQSFVVSGGAITLPAPASNVVAGLAYTGDFISAKMAYGAQLGTAMTKPKRINAVSLIMADVAWRGVRIGRSLTALSGLSASLRGRVLAEGEVVPDYDFDGSPFNGGWDVDSRMCFQIRSPYCATFLGAVVDMETNERLVPQRERR